MIHKIPSPTTRIGQRTQRIAWLTMAVLFWVLPGAARAANVSVPANTQITGVVSVPVSIDVADGIEGANFELDFGSTLVSVSGSVSIDTLTSTCMVVGNSGTPGVLSVALACQDPLVGGGVLFWVPFQADSGGSTPLTVSVCHLNEDAIPCTPGSGNLVVPPPTPTPSETVTLTPTVTATATRSATATATATRTATDTATATYTATATNTATATRTTTGTATATGTRTTTGTTTGTATTTRTVTVARTSTVTRTPTNTAPPTATPNVALNPMPAAMVVGQSITLSGSGFTAGSRIVLFVAAATGVQSLGPYQPTSWTPTSLVWAVSGTIPLANGFGTIVVVNTDQGFIQSNPESQYLFGAAALNIPTILSINGVQLRAFDPTVPLASVETAVAQSSPVTITGTGFNNPLVNLFSASGPVGPLTPQPGGTSTFLQVVVPSTAPTGPGEFQIVNSPYSGNVISNAVSVAIGAALTISSVSQAGSTITVTGTGFSTASVINLFNQQSAGVVNLGGYNVQGQPNVPLTLVASTQFTFAVPASAVSGAAYVQVINPPYIPFSSTGGDPDGAFSLTVP